MIGKSCVFVSIAQYIKLTVHWRCQGLVSRSTFVILSVDIDHPGIVFRDAEGGAGRQQAGGHRVILIVVLEHAGATDRQKVLELIKPAFDRGDVILVTDFDDRLRFVIADYEAANDRVGLHDLHLASSRSARSTSAWSGASQTSSPRTQKYSTVSGLRPGRAAMSGEKLA